MKHRRFKTRRAYSRRRSTLYLVGVITTLVAMAIVSVGCTVVDYVFGPIPDLDGNPATVDLGIAVVEPTATLQATVGVNTVLQWADIATIPGTTVRLVAQRQSNLMEDIGDPIHLIGDGTPGSGRDAIADGQADRFEWNITGVRVGEYVITAFIEAPDGTMLQSISRDLDRGTAGIVEVTTALPIPVLTFTSPGAADLDFSPGDSVAITWNDNGVANPSALQTLGLDTDADHESGNEIILITGAPLSDDDNAGEFNFVGLDENGDPVPAAGYRVFSIIDDNANDPVTDEATGRLNVAP